MCIILPIDHLTCTHTVAIFHHCPRAPTTKLLGPAPCNRIRQHSRPILTRKLCVNCGGPRVLDYRKPPAQNRSLNGIVGGVREEVELERECLRQRERERERDKGGMLKKADSGYSTTRESLSSSERSSHGQDENSDTETEDGNDHFHNPQRDSTLSSQSYRLRSPHIYENGHWTPRRGSEVSTTAQRSLPARSNRFSTLSNSQSRSIYSEEGSEVSEFEDAIGKARGSDWPKSPMGVHLASGWPGFGSRRQRDSYASSIIGPRDSYSSSDNDDEITTPTTTFLHPRRDSEVSILDSAIPLPSLQLSGVQEEGPDKPKIYPRNIRRNSEVSVIDSAIPLPAIQLSGVREEEEVEVVGLQDPSPGFELEEPSPSYEIDQYSVVMATTAKATRASRISFHGAHVRVISSGSERGEDTNLCLQQAQLPNRGPELGIQKSNVMHSFLGTVEIAAESVTAQQPPMTA
ncbi:hypothetical protein GQ43DRAFT_428098 [Delitschia confertaspora ATCC 74209]|uniref:Uncharacterized protein n=1 Tax=Delitschia confertaspora ATCC 74209 TaxID=1513339 RepID=A0A9P4JXM2_9PLEO|nr:hypothetical protein GQ43DRAFT_428098 [Delitschia confertaspora ATCC 74209]